MKIRTGFVSNSSSSSFICDVSGETYSGYDAGLEDFYLYQCENDHTFLEDYLTGDINDGEELYKFMLKSLTNDMKYDICKKYSKKHTYDLTLEQIEEAKQLALEKIKEVKEEGTYDDLLHEYTSEFRYNLPSCFCPICSLDKFKDKEFKKYMIKISSKTEEQIKKEIKENFSSYTEFKQFIS